MRHCWKRRDGMWMKREGMGEDEEGGNQISHGKGVEGQEDRDECDEGVAEGGHGRDERGVDEGDGRHQRGVDGRHDREDGDERGVDGRHALDIRGVVACPERGVDPRSSRVSEAGRGVFAAICVSLHCCRSLFFLHHPIF